MIISTEEKLMYDVMESFYDSGIPITFKGCMVLKATLLEFGYMEEIRHTADIDANWYSDTPPTKQQMENSLQKALSKKGIDLRVELFRMYGEGKSAGFSLIDTSTDEEIFSMDMDVNRPNTGSRIYQVGDLKFRGIIVEQILADKISVLSSDKIFRRIKDFIDLYYLSHCVEINLEKVYEILENTNRKLSDFNGFINRKDELQHAFEKFRFTGDAEKPDFENAYNKVYNYVKVFFQK